MILTQPTNLLPVDLVAAEHQTLEDKRREESAERERERAAQLKLNELTPPQWLAAEARGQGERTNGAGFGVSGGEGWQALPTETRIFNGNSVPARLVERTVSETPEATTAVKQIERALESLHKNIFESGERTGGAAVPAADFHRAGQTSLGVGEQGLSALSASSAAIVHLTKLGALEALLEDGVLRQNPELRRDVEYAVYKMQQLVEAERKSRLAEETERAENAWRLRAVPEQSRWPEDLRLPQGRSQWASEQRAGGYRQAA